MSQLSRYDIQSTMQGTYHIGYIVSVYYKNVFSYYIHKVYKTRLDAIRAIEMKG